MTMPSAKFATATTCRLRQLVPRQQPQQCQRGRPQRRVFVYGDGDDTDSSTDDVRIGWLMDVPAAQFVRYFVNVGVRHQYVDWTCREVAGQERGLLAQRLFMKLLAATLAEHRASFTSTQLASIGQGIETWMVTLCIALGNMNRSDAVRCATSVRNRIEQYVDRQCTMPDSLRDASPSSPTLVTALENVARDLRRLVPQ